MGIPEGPVAKRMGQIKKASERIVFLEERRISGDTYIFPYGTSDAGSTRAYWAGDYPNVMHGNGANFGFADGHADFHGWQCATTLEIAKRTTMPTLAEFNAYWSRATAECRNADGKWMENAVWGVMPR
jgi:prepilin-type processing-associated H-X9-DG protein